VRHAHLVMPRDTRHKPDGGDEGGGKFGSCVGTSGCGVIQVEPTDREGGSSPPPTCVDLCAATNAGCIVDDPELFREEEVGRQCLGIGAQGSGLRVVTVWG